MKIFITIVLLIISTDSYSFYSTPGNGRSWNLDSLVFYSGGHVTYSGGSYLINDTLTISSTDTLSVLGNTTIKLGPLSLINISGTMIVNPPGQVLITAIDTNQKFLGFNFSQYSDASILKKAVIEYGNGIKITNSDLLIDSCTIRFFTLSSNFSSGAINMLNASPIISNCTLYRNRRSAILSSANGISSPTLINNNIYSNNTENTGAWNQINLGTSSSSPIIIRNNIILGTYNQAGGISISALAGGSVQNCIIENNIIKNNRYGIAVVGNNINTIIINNTVDSNNTLPNPLLGGSGINFNGNSTLVSVVKRNLIRWNLWGITIQNTAKPDIGNLINLDTSDNGYNFIYGNIHNDSIIDLYNNTPDSIMAQNNYWGTTNLDTIEQHIVHKPDISSLGFVKYLPIYDPIGIEKNSRDIPYQANLYDAFPNPFNPSTKIKFSVPLVKTSNDISIRIFLKVYDILGSEVSILIDQKLRPGNYETEFNGKNLTSGVYLYRIELVDIHSNLLFSRTKKMILLK